MADDIMPELDRTRCTLCGACVESCPHGALRISQRQVILLTERCAYCGDCENVCPEDAIALPYEIVLKPDHNTLGG